MESSLNVQLVLLADDNPVNLGVLCNALSGEQLELAVATNGQMVLEMARAEPPDLILLDVQMPVLDGFEACRRLKEDPKTRDIPVIFMTSLNELDSRIRGFSLGAVDYISKPFEEAELLARVRTQLALRSMTRALQEQNLKLEKQNARLEEQFHYIEALQKNLERELDSDRVVARLMQAVQEYARPKCAVLLISLEDTLSVVSVIAGSQVRTGLREPLSDSHLVAHSVVQCVLDTRQVVMLSDATADSRFSQDPHLRDSMIHSLLAVPLLHQGRLGGLLYLEHETKNAFPPARVTLLGVLASQSAIALENASLYQGLQAANASLEAKVAERTTALNHALKELWAELDLAQTIQKILLPPAQVFSERYEFAGLMKPATQVGGDYFDIFEAGGKLWLLIGDVSGHGVSAGLIMMMVQTAVRSLVHSFADARLELLPSRLLTLVNRAVWNNLQLIGKGQYMTMTALYISEERVVHAGLHQSLLMFRGDTEQVQELESQGVWLGIVDEIEGLNQDSYVEFHPGDVLLLYTDGLTEARQPAGHTALLTLRPVVTRYLQACRARQSSEAVAESVLSLAAEGIVKDDISVVVLRHR